MLKSTLRNATIWGYAAALCLGLLSSPRIMAQSPVVQFNTNYVSTSSSVSSYYAYPAAVGTFASCDEYNYRYRWSRGTSNELKLTSFTANSKTYVVSGTASVVVKLRRVNNANVSGTRNIVYCETTDATATSCVSPRELDFKSPYNDDMATFLNDNVLNSGTDNLFTNDENGDDNNNNIERVDVIFTNGISSAYPAEMGFVLCERGVNNAHDGFRIAAILAKNGSNNPTSFGAVKTCVAGNGSNNGSWGHPTIAAGNKLLAAYVLRKDASETYLRVSSNVNQEIGGVFFSLSDLGVAADQVIYGYTLIGPDGTAHPTSAQLLNTSDASVFPTTTTEVQGGGLDLISINTLYGTTKGLASSFVKSFNGYTQNQNAILNWMLNGVDIGTVIHLERSKDAVTFSPIYTYLHDGLTTKTYRDVPGNGTFFYRLQIESSAGAKLYSDIVQSKFGDKSLGIKIYPTLIRSGGSITVDNIATGTYTARLQNIAGASIFAATAIARNDQATVRLPQKQLPPGIYYLVIEKDGNQIYGTGKLVIQND